MGRARIEQQKQIELANIETKKQENIKKINIVYETRVKAAKTIGYIGVAFLVVLFGSIFLNDLIKLCIYLFNGMREWWREKKRHEENQNQINSGKEEHVQLEMDHVYGDDLEEKLEKVYFRLLEVNSNQKRIIDENDA